MKVFSVDFLVRGGNFLLIFVFTAIMTQKEFGIYGYLYSFAMVMSGIVGFGFNVSLTKSYADTITKYQDRKNDMLFTLTTSMVCLLTIAMAVIYGTGLDKTFFALMNDEQATYFDYSNYRLYTAIAIVSTVFTSYLTYFFVSSEQIKNIQRFNLLRFFLANSIAIVIIIVSDKDSVMLRLAITYLTELILTLIFGKMFFAKGKFDKFFLKKALKIGLPVMGTAAVYAITNFGDKYFVMAYCGVEQFAVYNLALLIAMILLIVFQSFNFIWLPLFMKEQDLVVQRRKMRRFAVIIFVAFVGLSVLIWFGVMLMLKFGMLQHQYEGILTILPILLVSQIALSLAQLYINYMTYFEKTHIQFAFGIFLSAIAIVLYYFSVKWLGVMGICLSLLVVNVLCFVLYFFRSDYYIFNRLK
jgi:O-antigen/teichoic acid export membrane protein